MQLAVQAQEYEGVPVLVIAGDLDGVLVDDFEQAMIGAATECDGCVIVELTGVTYIDSQSFGRLLKTHVVLENMGGDVAIVAQESCCVSRIIHTFGADYLLAVFSELDPAAGYLKPLIEARQSELGGAN
jgi:anti-anti-sigma factor